MPRKNKKPSKQRGRRGPRQGNRRNNVPRNIGRPTLVLKAHALIAQNITAVNVKQITIAPTLSIFNDDILKQAKYFQQYRISRVNVHFLNLDPVNYQQGANSLENVYVHQVPLHTAQVPLPSQTSFLAFKNVRTFSYRSDFKRSFVPFVNSSADQKQIFMKSPLLPTTSVDVPHFGLSFLFVKVSPTVTIYTLRAIVQCQIQFYTYDGNNGLSIYDPQKDAPQYAHSFDQAQIMLQYSSEILQPNRSQRKRQPIRPPKVQQKQLYIQPNLKKAQQKQTYVQTNLMSRQQVRKKLARQGVQRNPGPIFLSDQHDQAQEPPDLIC